MKRKTIRERTEAFRWNSKQELYEYFENMYQIKRSEINSAIEKVQKTFQLRSGQPINTQELWEKVGNTLIKKHGAPVVEDTQKD